MSLASKSVVSDDIFSTAFEVTSTFMANRAFGGPTLPRALLEQIGVPEQRKTKSRWHSHARGGGGDRRKDYRVLKKRKDQSRHSKHVSVKDNDHRNNRAILNRNVSQASSDDQEEQEREVGDSDSEDGDEGPRKPEATNMLLHNSEQQQDARVLSKRTSSSTKRKFEEDDAEIAALERKLGLKSTKKKSRNADGLDDLLGDLDEEMNDASGTKRSRNEDIEWLAQKRRSTDDVAWTSSSQFSSDEAESLQSDSDVDDEDEDELSEDESASAMESINGFEDQSEAFTPGEKLPQDDRPAVHRPARERENPYVAPRTAQASEQKYVPRILRKVEDEDENKAIRRQAQGLLNKLSEANMISIIGDIEKLYREFARQHVTSTLITLLLDLFSDRTSLSDTFTILHGGFVAALYKVLGADFGAQFIEGFVERFDDHFPDGEETSNGSGKQASNLMTLLSQLYNFQVIACSLMFDYIRLLLSSISEQRTEILLRITKLSGSQLRQDDPTALKDMMLMLHSTVAAAGGHDKLSVRTKFMIETITDLKNNKHKTGAAASAIATEHTTRMKKTIGTLNQRTSLRATEPLRLTLSDIRNSDKKGKWWLVGASWRGHDALSSTATTTTQSNDLPNTDDPSSADLAQLARQQGLTTPVRRAIFIALVSATDCDDAAARLRKLRLSRAQTRAELPRVLVHCAAHEPTHNPFYSLVARRVSSEDHRLRAGFAFAMWDALRAMGERWDDLDDDDDLEDDNNDSKESLTATVNKAKLFADLLAHGGLSIAALKPLSFSRLKPTTAMFLEVLLVSALLAVHKAQRRSGAGRKAQVQGAEPANTKTLSLDDVFAPAHDVPGLAGGLRRFVRRTVARSDLVANQKDREVLETGCGVVGRVLSERRDGGGGGGEGEE